MTLVDYLAKWQLNPNSFARKLGVSNSTVHRWVHGARLPSMAYLVKIEKVTDGEVQAKDFYPKVEGDSAMDCPFIHRAAE